MKRIQLALSVLLSSFASVALALTVEPWAPGQVQTTCERCFFPEIVAVFVRDSSGLGVPNKRVVFSAPDPALAYVPNAGLGPWTVFTDEGGVARLPGPGLVTQAPGTFTILASSPDATGEATFQLTVSGEPAARIVMYGGDQQVAAVNTPYAQRFIVLAQHADGTPAPNAAVVFAASDGTFTGYAASGGNVGFGIVTTSNALVAPEYVAGPVTGPGEVHALLLGGNAPEVLFHYINSAAGVASLEMLPGSVPQSARITAFYPNPIGTIVRDAAGNPVANAVVSYEILFRETGGYGNFTSDSGSAQGARVVTGVDGCAVPDRVTASAPGTVDITATVPGAAPVHFSLDALPGGATRFELAGGENQRAIVGTTYPQPLSVRALGDDGLPVPNAAVDFYASPPTTSPTVAFAGNFVRVAMADANGVATSPPMTANDVVGFGSGAIFGLGTPFLNFHFENVSSALDVSFVGANPGNAPVGGTTWAPFRAVVSNKLGVPQAGVPFRFEADQTCGAFLGQPSYTGTTDASGIATSALFQAVAPRLACDLGFTALGSTYGVGVSVHTFAPSGIVLTAFPSPLTMSTLTSQNFGVFVAADGLPVYYPATIGVMPRNGGANATVDSLVQPPGSSNVNAVLTGNSKSGTYDVVVTTGPVQLVVPATQRKK